MADDQTILDAATSSGDQKPGSGEPSDKSQGDQTPADKAGAGTPADGDTKTPADAPKDGEGKPVAGKDGAAGPQGAPEKYESFKVPEGVTLDAKGLESFQGLAKQFNLSQSQAQQLVDFQTTAVKNAMDKSMADFKTMQETWKQDTRKALGPEADKQLGYAAAARDKFATPELRQVLNDSGLANQPDVVKFFISVGKAISEDNFVEGKVNKASGKSAAEIMYPDMQKN